MYTNPYRRIYRLRHPEYLCPLWHYPAHIFHQASRLRQISHTLTAARNKNIMKINWNTNCNNSVTWLNHNQIITITQEYLNHSRRNGVYAVTTLWQELSVCTTTQLKFKCNSLFEHKTQFWTSKISLSRKFMESLILFCILDELCDNSCGKLYD